MKSGFSYWNKNQEISKSKIKKFQNQKSGNFKMNAKKSKNFKIENQKISKSENFKQENQEISNRKIKKFQNEYGHYRIVHYPKNQGISKSKNFKQKNRGISKSKNFKQKNRGISKSKNFKEKNCKVETGENVNQKSGNFKIKKFQTEEPEYYKSNGLSPNGAFEQGLISKSEYIGFIKGNIIKYVVRCDKKENPLKDIDKAMDYLELLKKEVKK